MRRVVVTGVGIVSSIGNDAQSVLTSLRKSRSGIEFIPEMRELGFRCQVGGRVENLDLARLGKRPLQTMSNVSRYAAIAALEAIEDAGLPRKDLASERVAVVVGTSFGAINELGKAEQLLLKHRNPLRLGATGVLKLMHSTAAGNLAAWLGVHGRSYALCSSFCTGLDTIGHGYELIARGAVDVCLCGASEENPLRHVLGYMDNAGEVSTAWNHQPTEACRPYDRDRDGTVFSEGAGILILEDVDRALARGADVYAEIIGYGAANDGYDMFHPSSVGLRACIQGALAAGRERGLDRIDYVNSHGTGTKIHDALEVEVIRGIFGPFSPLVSSTKALAGHSFGATGAHEAIFTLLMLRHGFVAPTVNLKHLASDCEGVAHVQSLVETPLRTAMTFNAGWGGSNAAMIFHKWS
jgi:3-oxoacyl-[acyl-carrier-protein] synthase I